MGKKAGPKVDNVPALEKDFQKSREALVTARLKVCLDAIGEAMETFTRENNESGIMCPPELADMLRGCADSFERASKPPPRLVYIY